MSWFNASHLSSFAKQALTSAQKSIDRVLDIKEEDQWDGTTVMPHDADVTLPGKLSLSGGWGLTQWEAPAEEKTITPPPSSEAITTPVTRTVVDESENFFSAFLSPGDSQAVTKTQVVSVPPTKSQRRPQEKEKQIKEAVVQKDVESQMSFAVEGPQSGPADKIHESQKAAEIQVVEIKPSPADTVLLQPVSPVSSSSDLPCDSDSKASSVKTDADSVVSVDSKAEQSHTSIENQPEKDTTDSPQPKSAAPSDPSPPVSTKEVLLEHKDSKTEDRQNDTPSPPVSAFSSGTSTTSDIEVLDHESVLSESSASSRQETGEGKTGLHLMQGSFQLLTASTCGDFPRLEDYPKLTESCGSSSDAFERIDSFSVQSLDSRSVSEVNSDDEIPGSRTLASVTAGPAPLTVQQAECQKQEGGEAAKVDEKEEDDEEGFTETMREQSLDEMEESGRSATPVNSEQPEDLTEQEANLTLSDATAAAEEQITPPITAEMKSASTVQILELQKVIDELSGRLEKRESQLLAVSKDKATLEEECDNLKDEVIGLKEESSTVQSLKEEFTQRIAEAERKAQLACKERDIAKKEIKGLREDLSTRLNASDTMEIIKEKEEQIRGLLEEGEKLSKQQLQHSNIIKKLRVKEKESDTKITKQQKKIKDQEEELRQLQQVLDGKEEVEKQHRENIKKLNGVVERQEKELSRLQSDTEELQEKNRSLEAALDNSYKELAELHKVNASRASEAEEVALSRETQAREQLSLALEKAQEEAKIQQEALANQVADLRLALQRAEQQQARKEDYLREEISELQQRLQDAETRNQELSQSVTSATRPLLRQIENLQASLGGQTASWEKLEKNISDRLADAQAQLAIAVEKERSATEELLSIKSQLASLESQNSLLRQEKARLLAQLDAEKNKREKLEDESSRDRVELENLQGEHNRTLEETKKEKLLLTNQLEMEKMKVEQEKKKCYLAQEALKEKERKATTQSVGEALASSTPSLSRSSSMSGADNGLHTSVLSQDDSLDHSLGTMTMSMSMSGTNLYEAARLSGGSSIIENLQSQLKLREGEIAQLQLEIANLERRRSVMAQELVRLTNQNDEMEEKVTEIPKLKVQLKDLEQRHNTILQMYGEKAEEAEELRLDLEDVKNMYKTQIDELLKNQK
ncbi:TATA element modulatory factor isoform X1 [Haplochromis burtoni]|uniref:TATA element modulatory factor isoform X1 n=1 Tax=Haplochromis burtoni TaxID=8153 RepID=UPI0003BD068B|nr:TATA element modulatory factor isoform X1 [Haplochromis burtoni]XP_005945522.1 TATA element modulatory factor isoform X1 [Haplochromis burtoni]